MVFIILLFWDLFNWFTNLKINKLNFSHTEIQIKITSLFCFDYSIMMKQKIFKKKKNIAVLFWAWDKN